MHYSLLILFHFLFYLVSLPFLPVSLARGMLLLFMLSRNQALVLLIYFLAFQISILFISSLIVYYFPPADSDFVCSSFLILLGGRCIVYLRFFLFFLRKAIKFPLKTIFAIFHRLCVVVCPLPFVSRQF